MEDVRRVFFTADTTDNNAENIPSRALQDFAKIYAQELVTIPIQIKDKITQLNEFKVLEKEYAEKQLEAKAIN